MPTYIDPVTITITMGTAASSIAPAKLRRKLFGKKFLRRMAKLGGGSIEMACINEEQINVKKTTATKAGGSAA